MRQLTLDGRAVPTGTVKQRIRDILRRHPDARNSYKALCFWYWMECEQMREVLATGDPEQFRHWLVNVATSPKTLGNRAMEVQREHPGLDACPEVREWRDRQAVAGPVGG